MFAVTNWCRCAAPLALVGALALAGCGKKADPTKAEGEPKPADSKGGPTAPKPAEPEALATAEPDATYTAKQIDEERKKDAFFLISRHPGKVVDVTGAVADLGQDDRGGGVVLVRSGESALGWLRFEVTTKQPWLKVLPGQTVTLRARTLNSVDEARLVAWEIVKAEGPVPATFTAEQFARERAAGATAFDDRYRDKFIILTGAVAKVDENADKVVTVELDAGGTARAACRFASPSQAGVPLSAEQKVLLKPGQKVKLLGSYSAGSLRFCFLLEPTS